MVALYLTSSEGAVGKTAICAGLGKHLRDNGKKVGYFKPIIAGSQNPPAAGADGDASFMKHILALEEPVELLCPVISDLSNLAKKVKDAYARVARGKDVVVVEGPWQQGKAEIVAALGAKVIVVADYSTGLPVAELAASYKEFGEHLLGVILNKVPRNRLENAANELSAQFGAAGINILGVLPEDRVLFGLTVGELAEHLQGEVLNNAEKSVELVENFMLGALGVDSGLDYFGRKVNKAVVAKAERPDLHLAALETPTSCLVISGNTTPSPILLHRAEEKQVPIISTKEDTNAIVTSIEEALSKTRFNQEKKLPRLTEIMEQHLDFKALYHGLGLATERK